MLQGSPSPEKASEHSAPLNPSPKVFDFTDYRSFLRAALNFRQAKNPSYSESALLKQAGFGANSRGYFGLIMSGKRNLSPKSILGFTQALKLSERETMYFENLVHYNQAETLRDKAFYFGRISQAIRGRETKAYELMKSQYNYFSHWYYVAIRELVSFADFQEEGDWIVKKLRGEVSAKEIRAAIQDLMQLELVVRNPAGRLVQSNPIVSFTDDSLNYTVVNSIHSQILDKTQKALNEDAYVDRSVSCVVMACDVSKFDEIREDVKKFRETILEKYGTNPAKVDAVLNLGIQLFHITPIEKKERKS